MKMIHSLDSFRKYNV